MSTTPTVLHNSVINLRLRKKLSRTSFSSRLCHAPGNARPYWRLRLRASEGGTDPVEEDKNTPLFSPETKKLPSLADPVDFVQWESQTDPLDALGTSPKRLLLGGLTATALALGGNFLGVTSAILGGNPEIAQNWGLDIVVPVNGFKRCVSNEDGYEFLYPAEWLEDQRMVLRNAEKRQLALDPLSSQELQDKVRRQRVAEPTSAYGPAAGSGEENVSVIAAPILPGFTLESMGGVKRAGESLLSTIIAPPGSGKIATLLNGREEIHDGVLYYILDYTVETPRWSRHNFAVFVTQNDTLLTFNAQASVKQWDSFKERFEVMTDSFRLLL